ncbi:MAG: transglutaminase domain-containing protein [Spirochaetales bacterium]|nr:transglutaminase domain-containing protein [Spirochaetales bacterium]
MNTKRRKKHPVFSVLTVLIWFFVILPGIKSFVFDQKSSSIDFNSFEETEAELTELIQLEKAQFPDDFIKLKSQWESYDTTWTSTWHMYKPYLHNSILELNNLDSRTISSPAPGSSKTGKKKTSNNLSNAEFWGIVYNIILTNNVDRLTNLSSAFTWLQEKNELSDREILEMIIDFIQEIPYEIPDNYYGLYTPSDVLFRDAGDCDSKSLLAALILKQLGYNTAIFYSDKYAHAMLGINVPSTGEYKEHNGMPYYFTEMTAKGWQIGELSPDCADHKYWYIISI